MTFLDKLERRFGFIAIPGLIRIIVAFTALVYLLTFINPDILSILDLNPARIRQGEVWRLVTYIFIPQGIGRPGLMQAIWVVFALQIMWFFGDMLHGAWGAFRVTLYFFVGMIGTTVAAFVFGVPFSNVILGASILFACGCLCPNEIMYVFFILPMKIKWIAAIVGAFLFLGFVQAPFRGKLALITALANFFIFFGPEAILRLRQRKEVTERRKRFEIESHSEEEPLHRCATCGATELTDPTLEFRVAKDGEEYCLAHLPRPANAPV
jgi:hypothetical protein